MECSYGYKESFVTDGGLEGRRGPWCVERLQRQHHTVCMREYFLAGCAIVSITV